MKQEYLKKIFRNRRRIVFVGTVTFAAVFMSRIKEGIRELSNKAKEFMKKSTEDSDGGIRVAESLMIRIFMDVLGSPDVAKKGAEFTTEVLNDPKLNEELLKYLIKALNHPAFRDEIKKLGIVLTLDILKDPEVQRDLTKLLIVHLI